ncbi:MULTISPECIES: hypothetical protein [unclassified Pseudoalteromonas]|uniref:hypothetical protein n=1 Tax=unclassified Pseudoalteromonas TaxID=194690 RepID=UPI0005A80EC7|nr:MULTISPECIES: hypothetical protein [unclassified Pseudoalteromonas]
MKLILVPDIFGCTTEFQQYANTQKSMLDKMINQDIELVLVDPYQGQTFEFDNDTQAYEKYLSLGGHEHYLSLIKKEIESNKNDDVYIVGFSAGASAIWRALDGFKSDKHCEFIGFYPSQIRNFLDIKLNIKSHIIFPQSESHFEVKDVMESLGHYESLKISHTQYQHGFMNPLSKGFNESAFNEFQMNAAVSIMSYFRKPPLTPVSSIINIEDGLLPQSILNAMDAVRASGAVPDKDAVDLCLKVHKGEITFDKAIEIALE